MLTFSSKWLGRPPRQSSRRDYAPLLEEAGSEDALDSIHDKGHQSPVSSPRSLWSPTLISAIALTIVNLILVIYARAYLTSYPPSTSFYPTHRLVHNDVEGLRRPSEWVNLDRMETVVQLAPQTFKNWPLLLAPIDADNPYTALGDDPRPVGTAPSSGRALRVSKTVSTIAQFRAVDYMMEFCQLVIKPPPGTVSGINKIEIYQLDLNRPLKARDLTFSNRPTCDSQRISGAHVFNGSHFQHNFNCPRDQVFSFEVRCEQGSACNLNWWQIKDHRDYGIFMFQSSARIAVY